MIPSAPYVRTPPIEVSGLIQTSTWSATDVLHRSLSEKRKHDPNYLTISTAATTPTPAHPAQIDALLLSAFAQRLPIDGVLFTLRLVAGGVA